MENKQEIIEAIKEEIDEMLVKYKFIALFWYYEKFDVKEIANILNIPEEIVEIRIDKVEAILCERMKKEKGRYSTNIHTLVTKAFEMIINEHELSNDVASRIHANVIQKCAS